MNPELVEGVELEVDQVHWRRYKQSMEKIYPLQQTKKDIYIENILQIAKKSSNISNAELLQ